MRWLIGIAVVMLIAHVLFKRAQRADARLLDGRHVTDASPSLRPPDGTHVP